MTAITPSRMRTADWGAFVVGAALSGFFDGILLHQVLQWHHFLSLVEGSTFDDLRTQVWADGMFHVAVYCIAALGLYLFWRGSRQDAGQRLEGRRILGFALLGFGVWNVADVGIFHWVLELHRIRVNVPNPMLYDLAWITILGFGVAAIGAWLARRDRSSSGRGGMVAAALSVALLASVPVANRPVANAQTVILFGPGTGAAGAVAAAGARIVMLDPSGSFAVVDLSEAQGHWPLYRGGALLVSSSPALAGCLAASAIA